MMSRTPQTNSIHPLTTKNMGVLMPHKSHLSVKMRSLEEFGKLLSLWKMKDPVKQVTKILFQDNELLSFSLKSVWGNHHFFPSFEKQSPPGLTPESLNAWLSQFNPILPKELISLPQVGFKTLDQLPPPPKMPETCKFQGLSPLSETIKCKVDCTWGYDMNSLYPFCMLLPLPSGTPQISQDAKLDQIFGLIDAKVTPPYCPMPSTPSINEGISSFSLPSFEGVYFSEELKYLKDQGYKITLSKGWHFNSRTHLSPEVLQTLFLHKQMIKSNPLKMWLNSIYGSLSFSKVKPQTVLELSNKRSNPKKASIPNSPWSLTSVTKTSNFSNPYKMWGGMIMAYARMMLHSMVEQNQPTMAYLDTDAAFTSQPYPPQNMGLAMGQFKPISPNMPMFGAFVTPKVYTLLHTFNDIIKVSGVSDPSFKDILALLTQLYKNPPMSCTPPFMMSPRSNFLSQKVSFPFSHQ